MTPFHLRQRIARLLLHEAGSPPSAPQESAALAEIRELVRRSGSSFSYAFLFLPPDQKEALEAVYAFCRMADDAVDEPEIAPLPLPDLRRELERAFGRGEGAPTSAIGMQLSAAVHRFDLSFAPFELVLAGVEHDLVCTRYRTWEELETYCFQVAGAVGLLCIEIFGHRSERTREYARLLGIALQVTNILRDVAEDARRGRIYLPLEDLARFSVTEEDVLAERATPAFKELLRFEADRARDHYRRARALLSPPEQKGLFVAELMGDLYEALLDEIEAHEFDVLATPHRKLRRRRKIAVAVRLWIETHLAA